MSSTFSSASTSTMLSSCSSRRQKLASKMGLAVAFFVATASSTSTTGAWQTPSVYALELKKYQMFAESRRKRAVAEAAAKEEQQVETVATRALHKVLTVIKFEEADTHLQKLQEENIKLIQEQRHTNAAMKANVASIVVMKEKLFGLERSLNALTETLATQQNGFEAAVNVLTEMTKSNAYLNTQGDGSRSLLATIAASLKNLDENIVKVVGVKSSGRPEDQTHHHGLRVIQLRN